MRAGLLKKSGPWTQYPDRMLAMRARGFACRDGAADVLGGLYVAEELETPMRDVTPKTASLEVPDDIDTAPAPEPKPEPTEVADDPIADVAGYMARLEEKIALCSSDDELKEIAAGNADMIEGLPATERGRARRMLEEAAE